VLPVILFHTGLGTFSGGFIGVDVFFVISGYLITTIIFTELEEDKFSIINFYERRARRILPALFLVMFASLVCGYFLLMPDEFKNLGQSVVATSLFSNNILLGLTSGYWDMVSEFKPLLNTWSLGVEEQYYIVIPLLFVFLWRFGKISILYLIWMIFSISLCLAIWLVDISPNWVFYALPTRAWEICMGALAAFYLNKYPSIADDFHGLADFLSFAGFVLILSSIFYFDEKDLARGYFLLMPTIGSALIIVFCRSGSFVFSALSNKIIVFIGLLSYSLYLWHQPVFAYLRVYSLERPSSVSLILLLPVIFMLAFFTWKFVEIPFRNKSIIDRKVILKFSLALSVAFIIAGFYLNINYGMAGRVFDEFVSISDMDKRVYNEKAFSYKRTRFAQTSPVKILVIGNSFARDFVNITRESFDVSRVEIIYRDDLAQCINPNLREGVNSLFLEANVIVFASGEYDPVCYGKDIAFALAGNKKIYYIGTKDFGYNLNWIIRLNKIDRSNQFNYISNSFIVSDEKMSKIIPRENFISLLKPTVEDGKIPITDEWGRMLSTDRKHLTKYGAIYFGKKAILNSSYAELFK